MARSIRAALSPLLIISYVCGLRIVEFPAKYPRPWLSGLYHLLLWSTYFFLLMDIYVHYLHYDWKHYRIFLLLQMLTTLISLCIRLFYDKKFRDCLMKLDIVDATLNELEITMDYQKLDIRMAQFVAGWFAIMLIFILGDAAWWQENYNILTAFYMAFLVNYSNYTNLIDDLTFAYTLRYIGLKFDQVNELLQKLTDNEFTGRKRRIKLTWENIVECTRRRGLPNASNSEFITWIVIHLHLELCKISHEINSVFGIHITVKMASYYCFIAEYFLILFNMLFSNYSNSRRLFYIGVVSFELFVYLCRLVLINYSCEEVSNKAKATMIFINKVMHSTHNAEIRKHIVQLLLQIIRQPLRFCGIGLFQFGFKFLHRYFANIMTYLVILLQANKDNYMFLKNYIK